MNAIAPASYPQTSGDRETQLRQRIMVLERERDRLADDLAAMKQAFGIGLQPGLAAIGLTPQESMVVGVLLARDAATHDQIRYAMWPDDPDARAERNEKYQHVVCCKLRRKLAPHGVRIELIWGQGYRIPEADKATLRAMIAAVK